MQIMKKAKVKKGQSIQESQKADERKVALVVGGSSGIGHHAALKLLENDYIVYNASRTPSEDVRVMNLPTDVELGETITSAVNTLIENEGKIDVLIYSAGYSLAAPLEYTYEEDMYKLFEINYFGAVRTIQRILPIMRRQKCGKIILISSLGGVFPIAFDPFYSSSKAALNILAKELNMELKQFNIKCTAVQPGGTSTHFTYKRNIYRENEVGEYYDAMRKATLAIANKEQSGMTPEAVAEAIIKVVLSNNPPETVTCGAMNKMAKVANKLLPEKTATYLNENQYL